MTNTCTAHLSCTIPAILRRDEVNVTDFPATPEHEARTVIRWNGRLLGTLVDRGFRTWDDRWYTKWSAFSGGNAVIIPSWGYFGACDRPDADKEHVIRAIIEHATTAAFRFRMALHG